MKWHVTSWGIDSVFSRPPTTLWIISGYQMMNLLHYMDVFMKYLNELNTEIWGQHRYLAILSITSHSSAPASTSLKSFWDFLELQLLIHVSWAWILVGSWIFAVEFVLVRLLLVCHLHSSKCFDNNINHGKRNRKKVGETKESNSE